MKLFCLVLLLILAPLQAAFADTAYFLGPDRGVYMETDKGVKRVGLGTGNNLTVRGNTLYLAGDDGQIWTADQRGRWLPMPGSSKVQKVVVHPDGTLFALSTDGGIYRFDGRMTRYGLTVAQDLAVSGNGDLYSVGTDGKIWMNRASQLRGQSSWTPFNPLALARRLAVAPDGTVYAIGTDSGVYKIGHSSIERLGLATGQEISVSSDGQVGIVGSDGGVYLLSGSSRWNRLGSGTAKQVVWSR